MFTWRGAKKLVSPQNGSHTFQRCFPRMLLHQPPKGSRTNGHCFERKYRQLTVSVHLQLYKNQRINMFWQKKVGFGFWGRLNPYWNRMNPVFTKYQPVFFWETLGSGRKPRVCRTRIETVLTPYLTRITPYLNMGFEGAPAASFWEEF